MVNFFRLDLDCMTERLILTILNGLELEDELSSLSFLVRLLFLTMPKTARQKAIILKVLLK